MNSLAQYTHEESFGEITDGEKILEEAIEKRNKAILIAKEIADKVNELNSIGVGGCAGLAAAFQATKFSFYSDEARSNLPKINEYIDTKFWHSVIDRSSITAVMHSQMKEQFLGQLSDKPLEFSRENVYGTLMHYMENRWVIYVDGAVKLFRSLDKSFKTNDGIKVKNKIIFKDALGAHGYSFRGVARDRIIDLERIFMIMDGVDPTKIAYDEWSAMKIQENSVGEDVQLAYFKAKTFLNGNIHITLTRPDLVDRLNTLIAETYGQSLGHRTGARN